MKRLFLSLFIVANIINLLAITKNVVHDGDSEIITIDINDYKILEDDNFSIIELANSYMGGEIGEPNIPYLIFQFSTPIGFTPEVNVNIIETKRINLTKAIQPIPDLVSNNKQNEYVYNIDKKEYSKQKNLVSVLADRSFRNVNFSEIRFNPFRYDHSNQILEVITKAELITQIPRNLQNNDSSDRYAQIFISQLANPHNYFLSEMKYRDEINFADFSIANHWFKIEIPSSGIYALDYNDLKDELPINDIDPRNIRIFSTSGAKMYEMTEDNGYQFREIPILIEGEADGSFDTSDKIIFYARNRNGGDYLNKLSTLMTINPYSDSGIYWLSYDAVLDSSPSRMNYNTNSSTPSVTRSNNPKSSRYEREYYKRLQTNLYWYSNFLNGLSTTTNSFELKIDDLDTSDNNENSVINVTLIEESNGTLLSDKRHEASIALNGSTTLNSSVWYGYTYKTISSTAPSLVNGRNNVGVTIQRTSSDNLYLDYIEIQYLQKNIKHNGEQLAINFRDTDLGDYVKYSVQGSFNSNTRVFSTNTIYEVEELEYSIQDNTLFFTGYTPAYTLNKSKYYIPKFYVTSNDYLSASISSVDVTDIISEAYDKESIIIYPELFLSQAQRLQEIYQSVYNSPTAIINLTDIFNQFSGGMDDPTAIRNFLSHMYYLQTSRNIHYVTLLGIGTYDWKNYKSNSSEKNKMIIYQTGNSSTNEAITSDDYFAYLTQRIHPELAIGRYPAKNQTELDMMIDKFEIYSNKDFPIDWWRNTGIFFADDLKNGTATNEVSHSVQLNQAANNAPASLINNRIYAYQYEPDEFGKKPNARKDFIDAINKGALMTYYSGHGSYDQLGSEAYFRQGIDTPLLTNDEMRTFFISAACDVSQFDSPDFDCLSTDLMLYDAGGAIATYGSTRICYIPNNNNMVGNLIYFALDNREDIGTAIMLTKTRETSSTSNATNQSKYVLFGDPHLEITPPEGRNNLEFEYEQAAFKARDTVKFFGSLGLESISNAKIIAFQSDSYTPINTTYSLLSPGNYIFTGSTSVNNGKYSSAFVVPDDIVDGDLGKIIVYGIDNISNKEVIDFYYPLQFAGFNYDVVNESAPEISLWLESYDFREGDVVSQNPMLYVEISDTNGINVSGGSGHQLLLMIDDDFNSYDLTPYFKYDIDSYQTGKIEFKITDLTAGNHILKILAFDNLNQPSVKTTSFTVSESSALSISNILPYPNPMPKNGGDFTFMLSEEAEVSIDIYTITGKKIQSLSSFAKNGFNKISWNGKDKHGDKLANNTYFYIIKANAQGKSISARSSFMILD